VRRSARWAARLGRLEVSGGGDVVHCEDYRAVPPPVLGGADQALGNSDLVGRLPGVAVCLAIRGLPGPCVATAAIAPAADIRSVA